MDWIIIIILIGIPCAGALFGVGMAIFGAFQILTSAFRNSVSWGLGCLFVPFCQLFYLIVHWEDAKEGLFTWFKGFFIFTLFATLAAITIPNFVQARAVQLAHVKEHMAANPATSPTDKDHSVTNVIQKNQKAASASHQTLRLQGISYHPTRASAIINGNTVFVGEKVAEWSVTAISNETVTLQDAGGQTNILSLK